jgi:site-specific DNA recombinase
VRVGGCVRRFIHVRFGSKADVRTALVDLRRTGVKTKLRPLSNGRTIGGIPFARGSLAALLRNRFYIGEVRYKGEIFSGEQPAVLDRALFEAVQTQLDQQRTNYAKARQKSQSLLTGRIFDARGNRMTPSHAVKNGVRYRYYISSVLIQGQADKAATLNRLPAAEIETLIIIALRKHLTRESNNKLQVQGSRSPNDQDLISTHIARVDIKPDHIAVQLSGKPDQQGGKRDQALSRKGRARNHANPNIMVIPWRKLPSKRPREIILPAGPSSHQDSRPIRSETRIRLVTAIVKGRRWLDALMAGTVTNVDRSLPPKNAPFVWST